MSFHLALSNKKGISGKVLSVIISLVIGITIIVIYFSLFGPTQMEELVNQTFFNISLPGM